MSEDFEQLCAALTMGGFVLIAVSLVVLPFNANLAVYPFFTGVVAAVFGLSFLTANS
jgi:hypothetical protein